MRTLLIVDDEAPSRELIKMSIDWKEAGFEGLIEARNGREALEQFEMKRPLLTITDIQMPVMDGLEFIRAARALDPAARIMILSCHERFTYAREALKLGVLDYIIKDSFTAESLMSSVAAALDGARAPDNGGSVQGERALRMALDERVEAGEAERVLAAALDGRCYFVCAVRAGDVPDAPPGGLVNARGDLYSVAFLEKTPSRQERAARRAELIRGLRASFAMPDAPLTVGVSRVFADAASLKSAVHQAKQALMGAVFEGAGRDVYYDEAAVNDNERAARVLQGCVARVREALCEFDEAALAREISALYRRELAGMRQYNYLKHVNALLIGMLTQAAGEGGVKLGAVFGGDMLSMDMLDGMDTVEAIADWFTARFLKLSRALKPAYSPRLQRIVAYLDGHYAQDVSLEKVAERFHIHKVYLAKVFKAETGVSVNEYIREKRIGRAKALLQEPGARVGEVVDLLGFHNPQTFYNLFKRMAGMSPSEYKELCEARRAQSEDEP